MEQSENKRKKRKKAVMTVLFILLNIAVIAWTAIKEFGGESDSARFSDVNINYIYIIPAALCCFGAIFAETVKYALLMKKVDGRVDFKVARRVVLLGRYYDNVTPSGIGGQPFQIYYMSKNGYSDANSAAIPLAGFMSMQYAFILLAAVCFIKIMLIDRLLLGNTDVTPLIAAVVCVTMALTVLVSKVIGCILPVFAKKMGFDPAVMSSPFITTIIDAVSLLLYFALATSLLF